MAKRRRKRKIELDCPFVADCRFPSMGAEATGEIARKVPDLEQAIEDWKESCRTAVAEEKDPPEFPKSKLINPNTGRMTRNQVEALEKQWNAGEDVVFPPTYNPVMVELLAAMSCQSIRKAVSGKKRRQSAPSDWDEKKWGSWYAVMDGEDYPSGWYIEKKETPRICHARNVEELVADSEASIVKIGGYRYVVGDGTVKGSALYHLNLHFRSLSKSMSSVWIELASAGMSGLANLVWRVEDRANVGGAFVIRDKWRSASSAVNELPFLPGQVLTVGNLVDADGNIIEARQIRKLAEGDHKGLRFQALKEPMVGTCAWSDAWKEIQRREGRSGLDRIRERPTRQEAATPQGKTLTNAGTQCRTEPCENTPYGIRGVQANVIQFQQHDADGNVLLGIAIGARSRHQYHVLTSDAKRTAREAEAAKAESKPKAEKKGKAKAEKKGKADKKPKAKSKAKGKKKAKAEVEAPTVEEATPVAAESETDATVAESEAVTAS